MADELWKKAIPHTEYFTRCPGREPKNTWFSVDLEFEGLLSKFLRFGWRDNPNDTFSTTLKKVT